ncbi:phage terminase large subunit [Salipiger bermudensis]|uniref:phage terminase large subunit n=1 Tax=Salipiger bermudensis TaxID=344736 RepID=UPI00300B66ED
MQIQPIDVARRLYRDDLTAYTQRAFAELREGAEFHTGYHIRAICHHLQQFAQGKTQRLMILMPPRHLKSTTVSVAFTAWMMGRNPGVRIMAASYGSDLAENFGRETRKLIEAPWHRDVFPTLELDRRRATASELRTTRNGARYATSVGGSVTGKGGDIVIIDDPMKAEDAQSETMRDKAHDWYRGTTVSRLDDPKSGAIIVVAQRLHEDDLPGRLIPSGDWTVLELPAIETRRRPIALGDGMQWTRDPGEALLPEHMDRPEYERIKREIGLAAFAAQYQQTPSSTGGIIVRPEWFGTYSGKPHRNRYEGVIQSWDTAAVPGESNDYSVCTTWGLLGNHIDLLDVHRGQHIYPEMRHIAQQLRTRWKPEVVVIEAVGSGIGLYQELYRAYGRGIRPNTPKGSKLDRMVARSAMIADGQVRLPETAPWKEAFIAEVAAFPNGKHDDQVDSLSQALEAVARRLGELRECSRYKG